MKILNIPSYRFGQAKPIGERIFHIGETVKILRRGGTMIPPRPINRPSDPGLDRVKDSSLYNHIHYGNGSRECSAVCASVALFDI